MAKPRMDLSAFVGKLLEEQDGDVLREGIRVLSQALMETEVAGLIGDPGMVEPWARFLVSFRSSYAFGPLLPFETHSATDLISAFCTGCCGGVYLVTGRLDAAEEQLVRALAQMSRTGLRPRCLHPVADLVALRVLQGRLEEAEALITGFENDLDCAPSAAAVDMALGRPARAVERLVAALGALASGWRSQFDLPLIAVETGGALGRGTQQVPRAAGVGGAPGAPHAHPHRNAPHQGGAGPPGRQAG